MEHGKSSFFYQTIAVFINFFLPFLNMLTQKDKDKLKLFEESLPKHVMK